jgi:hypothetical protein
MPTKHGSGEICRSTWYMHLLQVVVGGCYSRVHSVWDAW